MFNNPNRLTSILDARVGNTRTLRFLGFALATHLFLANLASSQITFEFTETATGGLRVTGTGSGLTTGSRRQSEWNILNFNNDFLADTIGQFDDINADTVTGTFSTSGGPSRNITGFFFNRSQNNGDDLAWITESRIRFRENETFSFFVEATFQNTTISFADLSIGNFQDRRVRSRDEIFGMTRVNVVSAPEPTSFVLCAVVLLGFVFFKRHRITKLAGQSPLVA